MDTSGDKLTPLQWRILEVLAGIQPSWTLTGGAALAGVHLKHRTTKDLDLFWHDRNELGALPLEVRDRLTGAQLEVDVLQSSGTFYQFRVRDGQDVCVVDLVAETGAAHRGSHPDTDSRDLDHRRYAT